jgi:hypothetical protein
MITIYYSKRQASYDYKRRYEDTLGNRFIEYKPEFITKKITKD